MAAHGHRRQVLLFLVAIILPCVVLVVLGVRMMVQERELSEKRLVDERRGLTSRLRQELSTRLDRIALEQATALLAHPVGPRSRDYGNPAVVLVASAANGSLTLPWEGNPSTARFRDLLEHDVFARLVAEGERAEIASGHPEAAVDFYARALAAARDPAQGAYARLLRARALLAAGRRTAALSDLESVLGSGPDLVDEHGVPLALYAASRLLEAAVQREAVIDRVRRALEDPHRLPPTALYLLRDLVENGGSATDSAGDGSVATLATAVAERIACTEQMIALKRDFPRLGLGVGGARMHNAGARWVVYGAPAWLVGRARPLEGEDDIVVVVRAESLFAAVEDVAIESGDAAAELAIASDHDGGIAEPLGTAFPGIVARFPASAAVGDTGWDARRWFYLVALLLVVSVTLFGAYFVSRDVRRELRLAEMRSRFVSAVSHELKTPLTAIRMFAETLQLRRSSDPETQAEYLDTIVNESERLTRLLNNVLDFSKIERGKKEYRRTPNDLADIVRATAHAMQYPLEQQEFTLNVEVQEGLTSAAVDRDAVEQAILNLLANAMKYSGSSRQIDLRLKGADGHAVIEVEDHGVGIDPAEQKKIFQQFYRVPTRDNDGIPGTGLGLTLVQHIAEGHAGRVTVDSTPGRGSTFAIHLPLGDGPA
jgi:signal transduction histidine kinase